MNKENFIGKAKARVNFTRNGHEIRFGELVECTQEELDGGYFAADSLIQSSKGKDSEVKKMMTSPQNKSLSSKSKKEKDS